MLLRPLLILLTFFSLAGAVAPAQAQRVQLAWDAPLQANGTPVTNLAGYRLYYGSQSGNYQTMVPVGITTTYMVTNLSAGQTYYFSIQAYSTTGTESPFSNEVSVTLPAAPLPPLPGTGIIPYGGMRVVSVDSQELVGENGAATNAIDGKSATLWHTQWYQRTAALPHTLLLDLGARYQVDGLRYLPRQDGDPNGTIAGYQFYVSDDGVTWGTPAAAGTFAANTSEKTVRFTAKTGRFVRLVALTEIHGQAYTSAAELSIFGTPTPTSTPPLPGTGIIPYGGMRVVSVDSQELVGENGAATNAIDGKSATLWHTQWYQRTAALPHTLLLDLGARYQVDGLRYLPRQDGDPNGTIAGYQFYVSDDGVTWGTPAAAGTFAANTSEKTVRFTAKTGRFVRLVALTEIHGQAYTSAAELSIFGTPTPTSTPSTSRLLAPSATSAPMTSSSFISTVPTSPSSPPTAAATASATSSALTPSTTTSPNTSIDHPQGLQRVGRWFTINGQYLFLIGYDAQELAADPSLDYEAALDLFEQYRLNKVRIWIGYCFWDATFLTPWVVTNGTFDLDTWNPAFWQRLTGFVAAAQRRNIMVEATILVPNNIDDAGDWVDAAWNKANNVNGLATANAQGMLSPEFWDMTHTEESTSHKRLVDYQEALIEKTVLELGAFPNVYFELANEFPARNAQVDLAYPWQLAMAQRIKASTTSMVTAHAHEFIGDHLQGVEYYWEEPTIDVLGFHFATSDPETISRLLHPVQTHNKVLQQNEGQDPYLALAAATRAAWGWVLSGGHYALYEDDSSRIGSAGWRSGAQRLQVLRDIMDTVAWWQMSPVDAMGHEYDGLITQGPSGANYQVFANPGVDYLAYFWGIQSTESVTIRVPAGTYDYSWYDPRDGTLCEVGVASPDGAESMSIASPRASAWDVATGVILVIKRR